MPLLSRHVKKRFLFFARVARLVICRARPITKNLAREIVAVPLCGDNLSALDRSRAGRLTRYRGERDRRDGRR